MSDADKIAAMTLALDRGVDVNAVDGTGQTALHIAAGQSSARIVAALVAARREARRQGQAGTDTARRRARRRRAGGQPVVRAEIVEALHRRAD